MRLAIILHSLGMRQLMPVLVLCAVMLFPGCTAERQYAIAPTLLPGTRAEMNTAGYWIGQHSDPDRLLMTAAEIDTFNARIRTELKSVADITAYPDHIAGPGLRRELETTLRDIMVQGLWRSDGTMSDAPFYAAIRENLNLSGIADRVTTQFALVTDYADQRVLPTAELLCSERGDLNFDELQNSAYDIGTPVAVVHTSADSKWVYAVAPLSSGWLPADKVAFCTSAMLRQQDAAAPFAVVTAAKADLYRDRAMTGYCGSVRLGTRLPLARSSPVLTINLASAMSDTTLHAVFVPIRRADGSLGTTLRFIRLAEAHAGYLPLTPRSLIQAAFAMLNTPYGWGDMYGEQDCSRFIQQIFAAHGVQFPRNSTAQGRVGTALTLAHETSDAEKEDMLARAGLGGATVLELNGHIMLYLGSVAGKPYVIHDIWGYREHDPWRGDTVRAVNRVAVTGLELGRGSARGALITRLRSARVID